MQAMNHWGHFDGTTTRPIPESVAHPTSAENQAIKDWEQEDCATRYHLSRQLPDHIFIGLVDHKTVKGRWDQLIEELGQPRYEDTDKGLTREVPAQTTGTELEATLGEPGTINEVAHAHDDRVEPDLQMGQPGDPNVNTPEGVAHPELNSTPGEEIDLNASAHLEGVGPEVLMGTEEDRSLEVEEDGATGKTISVKGDIGPCVELQEPGVSCLATQENARSLTLPSPPPPTTLETASTQCSPAANTGTPDIPVPDHGTDLELPPHDTPLPNKAAEPPIHQPPEQTQAPTGVGGLLESLLGEASQRAKGQRSLTLAHTLEGNMPIGEAHGRPPDFANPQTQGSTAWEPAFVVPKARVCAHQARNPVFDEGACMRPDPWPNLGIVTINPDTCIGSASQLEGEQNINLPSVGSELHAAPSTPQHFSLSLSPPIPSPFDTLMRKNLPRGEGAATKRHAIEDHPRPKPSKPLNLHEVVQEAGGALLTPGNISVLPENVDHSGLVGVAENTNTDTGGVERASVDLHESGGVSALDDSPFLPGDDGSPRDLDSPGLAYTVKDVKEVKPLRVDAHKRGGVLPVVGAAPALAEDTVGVGPADKAEIACAAKPEALVSWAQEAGCGCEVDAQPHEALLQKGKRKAEALPRKREQRLNKGKREPI